MLKKILAVASICAMSFASQAALLPVQVQQTAESFLDTNFERQLSFDQFDTLGGKRILTNVHLSLQGAMRKTFMLENLSKNSVSVLDLSFGAILELFSNGKSLILALPTTTLKTTLATFDGSYDGAGNSGVSGKVETSALALRSYSDQSILDMFIGKNKIATNLKAQSLNGGTWSGGALVQDVVTQAHGVVTLHYEYEMNPVSEPTILAVFGLGLAGLALRARRRQL